MSALSICIVLRAFVVVISMCLLYVSLWSRVSPSIFLVDVHGECDVWVEVHVWHQTDTACSWLVCHSATVGGTVRGNTVQIVSTYPASPEARPPSFFGKPAVRPRSMAGGAPTPCGRH